ncbi:MAG: tRNA pseudouridine(38-40) synthase TruA [Candidatus Omnitrophica bacterium]|nr:tRNA pseudouridine(38-40) synthase TruA [Candidatus Omnitrophota bacterium]
MRTIKLTVEYDGTKFSGWQIQAKGERTIQGEIKKALEKILNEKITLIGSGRTDQGVHAIGQVAHFTTNSLLDPKRIGKALNTKLPSDIVVLKSVKVKNDFHAQYGAQSKIYRYTILNRDAPSAYAKNFCHHCPQKLDLNAMKKATTKFLGKKDFASVAAMDVAKRKSGKIIDTIRTIKKINIQKKKNIITIDIEATGFLYKMVRNITGTLIQVGLGKISPNQIPEILKARNRKLAGPTGPAKGLCLLKVKY